MDNSERIQPKLTFLSEENIQQIHQYSLRILKETGIRFESEAAIQILNKTDGASVGDNQVVTFDADLVQWAIDAAPSTIDIYSRQGELAFTVGQDRTRFGVGVTTLYYLDPASNQLRPFNRQDFSQMVRLGDQLPNYDMVATVGIIQDQPPETADLYTVLDMYANTRRPLVVLVSEEHLYPRVLDLFEHLHGDLSEKPFMLPYFNPVSPMTVNEGTIDKVIQSVQRGLPFIYSSYAMAGVSAPITPAGILAQMNAELLAGLVFAQLIKEGTPVVLGMLPAYFEMKAMQSFYDPASYLINLGCAEIMRYYRLPHCGTSGSGNGWKGDLIDFENYWINHLSAVMGHAGLAPFVGDTMRSKVLSPVNMVYVNEVIEKVLKFTNGIILDDESIGMEDIHKQGPGGSFLAAKLTRKHYKDAYIQSDIFPQLSMEQWQGLGSPDPMSVLVQRTQDIIASLQTPEDHAELTGKGETFIKSIA